jgi:acetyltransferase-like isoleucine patch superfamily enzyme
MAKIFDILREELYGLHPRWLLVRVLLFPIPQFVGGRLRVKVLNLFGFRIGVGTSMWGLPKLIGSGKFHQKLTIGSQCLFNVDCFFDLAGPIIIGGHVFIGPEVMLITGGHEIGKPTYRLGPLSPQPILIEEGVWLGARCTILPGITIGRGAVVAAGAVVTKDVAPNTLVGGTPAKLIRDLEGSYVAADLEEILE